MPLSFARPWTLLAFVAIPLLVWIWQRSRRRAIRFPALDLLHGLEDAPTNWVQVMLPTVGVGVLLLASAGPRTPDYATPIPVPGIVIGLVFDISGSMGERDFSPGGNTTRLAAAKSAAHDFLVGKNGFTGRVDDRVGLVTFAELPRTVAPPTLSHEPLLGLLDNLEPSLGPAAATSIGDALAETLDRLEATGSGRKIIVLITDGDDNNGGRADALSPLVAARVAEALAVPIYAIDCSPPGETPGGELLDRAARLSGGRRFRAADEESVRTALAEIDALEVTPAPSPRYRRYHDWTGVVAVCGAVLLTISWYLDRTRWAVGP